MSKVQDLIKKAKETGIIFQACPEYTTHILTEPNILYYHNAWSDERMVEEIEKKLEELENKTWTKYIKDETSNQRKIKRRK